MTKANNAGAEERILEVWDLAPDRPPIQFKRGGPVHHLASVTTLSIQDRAEWDRSYRRWEQLQAKKTPKPSELAEIETVVGKLAAIALPEMDESEREALSIFEAETAAMGFSVAFASTLQRLSRATVAMVSDEEREPGDNPEDGL